MIFPSLPSSCENEKPPVVLRFAYIPLSASKALLWPGERLKGKLLQPQQKDTEKVKETPNSSALQRVQEQSQLSPPEWANEERLPRKPHATTHKCSP